jgi:cytosine/uracil/thiamine/allantoin permease
MSTTTTAAAIREVNGQVELADPASAAASPYANPELVPVVLATMSVNVAAGSGPFPVGGLIPALKPLYDYSWVVGLGAGFAVYLVLSLPVFGRTGDTPAS